jgi:hypothetical protein
MDIPSGRSRSGDQEKTAGEPQAQRSVNKRKIRRRPEDPGVTAWGQSEAQEFPTRVPSRETNLPVSAASRNNASAFDFAVVCDARGSDAGNVPSIPFSSLSCSFLSLLGIGSVFVCPRWIELFGHLQAPVSRLNVSSSLIVPK